MRGTLRQAGEIVDIDCRLSWVDALLREAVGAHLEASRPSGATVSLIVEESSAPFTDAGWEPAGRGAWMRPGEVVLENACTSGFDLRLRAEGEMLSVLARWRPQT